MHSFDFEKHIILCGWNHRARAILHQLRTDRRIDIAPIVLIAEIDIKPIDDENLFFVQGTVNEENLRRANIEQAKTVIILGDDRLDANGRDAKTVLSTLTVESLNPDVYTTVELVDSANIEHCQRAHADEIVVGSEFSSTLLYRAAVDHGFPKILSGLLSSRFGNGLYRMPVPASMAGNTFMEVFTQMKGSHQSTVSAVIQGTEGKIITNPPADIRVEGSDHLML